MAIVSNNTDLKTFFEQQGTQMHNVSSPQFEQKFDIESQYRDVNGELGDSNVGVGVEEVNYTNTITNITTPEFGNTYVIDSTYGDVNGTFIDTTPKEGIQLQTTDSPEGFGSFGTNVIVPGPPTSTKFTNGPFSIDRTYSDVHGQRGDQSVKEGIQLQTIESTAGIGTFGTNVAPNGNLFNIGTPYTAIEVNGTFGRYTDGADFLISSNIDTVGQSAFATNPASDINNFDFTKYSNLNKYSDQVEVNDADESLSPLANLSLKDDKAKLKEQYKKFNLRKDSPQSANFGGPLAEPFILRGIQNPNILRPQTYGPGLGVDIIDNFITYGVRKVVDLLRLGKYYLSAEGVAFILKNLSFGSIFASKGPLKLYISGKTGIGVKHSYATTDFLGMKVAKASRLGGIRDVDFRRYLGPAGGPPLGPPIPYEPQFTRNWESGDQEGKRLVADKGFARPWSGLLDGAEEVDGDETLLSFRKALFMDKINGLKTQKAKSTADEGNQLIAFYLTGIGDSGDLENYMYFRATITGISDNFSPNWNPVEYIGRPSGTAVYQNTQRSLSFSFKVYAQMQAEMAGMWNKINKLATYCYPKYVGVDGDRMQGPMMSLTIGDLYVDLKGYMTSLSYSFPDDLYWDVNQVSATLSPDNSQYQLPRAIDVTLQFVPLNHQLEDRGKQLNLYGPAIDTDKPLIAQGNRIKYYDD